MREKRKKLLSGGTALICALAVLISGTLAWQAASQAVNPFSGTAAAGNLTGANLHDDFAGDKTGSNAGKVDKDVYVENTGNKDVFVRIQLREKLAPATVATLFKPTTEANGSLSKAGATEGFVWTLGTTTPKAYNSITDTSKWQAGVTAGKTAGQQTELIADAVGDGINLGGAYANTGDASITTSAGTTQDQANGALGSVISMAQYKAITTDAAKKAFVGWIYDVDGFAYWSQPLAPGTATGRLLAGVDVPNTNYTYEIVVDMEYVDYLDLTAWTAPQGSEEGKTKDGPTNGGVQGTEASDDAKALLRDIATGANTGGGEPDTTKYNKTLTAQGGYRIGVGETKDAPTVKDADGEAVEIIKWTSSNEAAISVNATGQFVAAADALGKTATMTGVDVYGNKVVVTLTVGAVTTTEIIEHPDRPGEFWQDNGDNTYTEIDQDTYDPLPGGETVWGGDDGNLGGGDDKPAIAGKDNVRYVAEDPDTNVFYPVIKGGTDNGKLGDPITGGHDMIPGEGTGVNAGKDATTEPKLVEIDDTWYLEHNDGTYDAPSTTPGTAGKIDTPDDIKGLTKITPEMDAKMPPASDFDDTVEGFLTPEELEAWEEAVEAATVVPATGITFGTTPVDVEVGKSVSAPTTTIAPADATGKIVWTSSDDDIAIVDENTGEVTGVEVGVVTITATITNPEGAPITQTYDIEVLPAGAAEQKILDDKLVAALDADVLEDGYLGASGDYESLVEQIKFATWIESPTNKYLIQYYETPHINGKQQPGTLEDNYAAIPVAKLLADGNTTNVTFTSDDSKVVEIKDGKIYIYWLPSHEEYMSDWLNPDKWGYGYYRTTVTVTANYEEAGKKATPVDIEIHVSLAGVFVVD